jgi:hypothetical protein
MSRSRGARGAALLQPAPEALDEVLDGVPVRMNPRWAGDGRIGAPGRDRRASADVPDQVAESAGGEAAVAHHPGRGLGQACK